MIGTPKETVEDIHQTIDFVLNNNIGDFHMTFFTPLPGSDIYNNYETYGALEDDRSKMNCWAPIFISHGLTKEILIRYQRKAFLRFYFRFMTITNYFKQVKSFAHFFCWPEHLLTWLEYRHSWMLRNV